MAIRCCYGCVAPKRYPGCHGSCPEYLNEKALHEAAREEAFRAKQISAGLSDQRFRGVTIAERHKRKRWGSV